MLCIYTGFSIGYNEGEELIHIFYPFTQTPFLNVDNNWSYMVFNFILPLGLYGIFFLLTSNVFKVFCQPKLFKEDGVKQLKLFYLANILVPTLATIFASFFVGIESFIILLIIVHFVLGIFAYFFAEIFKQGLHLQNEQDLFV
jgi:fatty acid desaturase